MSSPGGDALPYWLHHHIRVRPPLAVVRATSRDHALAPSGIVRGERDIDGLRNWWLRPAETAALLSGPLGLRMDVPTTTARKQRRAQRSGQEGPSGFIGPHDGTCA
jgi:hypothetical protein